MSINQLLSDIPVRYSCKARGFYIVGLMNSRIGSDRAVISPVGATMGRSRGFHPAIRSQSVGMSLCHLTGSVRSNLARQSITESFLHETKRGQEKFRNIFKTGIPKVANSVPEVAEMADMEER